MAVSARTPVLRVVRTSQPAKPWGRLAVALLLTAVTLVAVVYLVRHYATQQMRLAEIRAEAAGFTAQQRALEEENWQLTRELERLQSAEYIEVLARQRLGLVRPGEIPYMAVTKQPQGE